ncbi:MAG: hypothetical protein WC704_17200 [Sphingomonas sp.]
MAIGEGGVEMPVSKIEYDVRIRPASQSDIFAKGVRDSRCEAFFPGVEHYILSIEKLTA